MIIAENTQIEGSLEIWTSATITSGGIVSAADFRDYNFSGSKALVSDSNKSIVESSVTSTQIGYLSNTSADIQTQLDERILSKPGASIGSVNQSPAPNVWYKIASWTQNAYQKNDVEMYGWSIGRGQKKITVRASSMYEASVSAATFDLTVENHNDSLGQTTQGSQFIIGNSGSETQLWFFENNGGNNQLLFKLNQFYDKSRPITTFYNTSGVPALTTSAYGKLYTGHFGDLYVISATANTVPYLDSNKKVVSSSITPTQLGYLSTTSANIQTQLSTLSATKQNLLTNPVTGTGTAGTFAKFTGTSTVGNSIVTESGSVVTVGGHFAATNISASTLTIGTGVGQIDNTEFSYLNGVSANIQTQLNALSVAAVSGSGAGTTNKITKFVTPSSMGDSTITDNGSLVTFATQITTPRINLPTNTNSVYFGTESVLGDSSTAHTLGIASQVNSALGYVKFGTDANILGYDGSTLVYAGTAKIGNVSATTISGTSLTIGNVSNTEFSYLDGTSANIQTQLSTLSASKAVKSITITAGTGLTGGGDLSTNRTISLATTGTAGTYTKVTTNAYGQVTAGTTLTSADIPTLGPSKISQDASNRFVTDTEKANWNIGYTSAHNHPNKANLDLINQSLALSASPIFDSIHLSANGSGDNIRVGDDAFIGDINAAHTLGIRGVNDATKGYIKFGSDSNSFGYDGATLVYTGTAKIAIVSATSVSAITSTARTFQITEQALTTYPSALPPYAITQTMGTNDQWRIYGEGGSNAGAMFIETGDDGTESINLAFRQSSTRNTAYTFNPTTLSAPAVTATFNSVSASTLTIGNISNTEFNYLDGVTSGIQAQLNAKSSTGHTHQFIVGDRVSPNSSATQSSWFGDGLYMSRVYGQDYPASYGNILSLDGTGRNQIFLSWAGTDAGSERMWFRNKRDNFNGWSPWQRAIDTVTDSSSIANWNSAYTAVANVISGSGTSNYIPKFTGTRTVGNSSLLDETTLLTYGTNTGNTTFKMNAGTGATSYFQMCVGGSEKFGINNISDITYFNKNTSEFMRVESGVNYPYFVNSLKLNSTANRVVLTDASQKLTTSTITNIELGHLSGVSSNIQAQLNGKPAISDTVRAVSYDTNVNLDYPENNTIYSFVGAKNATSGSPFGNAYYNTIDVRHRNGSADGLAGYGGQLVWGMTNFTNRIAFRTRNASSWQSWNEIWTNANLPITATHLTGTTSNIQTQLNGKVGTNAWNNQTIDIASYPASYFSDVATGDLTVRFGTSANKVALGVYDGVGNNKAAITYTKDSVSVGYALNITPAGIKFPDNAFGGGGDTAGMRLVTRSGEDQSLELYVTNDITDWVNLVGPDNNFAKVNGNTIWNAGNLTQTSFDNWNTAYTSAHFHNNKSNLDSINQNLGTTSQVIFSDATLPGAAYVRYGYFGTHSGWINGTYALRVYGESLLIGNTTLDINYQLFVQKDITPTTATNNNYALAPIVINRATQDSSTTTVAGIGFHNAGVNAATLYYDTVTSVFKYNRNISGPLVTIWDDSNFTPGNYLPKSGSFGGSDGYEFVVESGADTGGLSLYLRDNNDGSEYFAIKDNSGVPSFIAYSDRTVNVGYQNYQQVKPLFTIGDGQYGLGANSGYLNLYSAGGGFRAFSKSGSNDAVYLGDFWHSGNFNPSSKSDVGHIHDDRYYTESETNSILGNYLPLTGGTMTGNIVFSDADEGVEFRRGAKVGNIGSYLTLRMEEDNNNPRLLSNNGATSWAVLTTRNVTTTTNYIPKFVGTGGLNEIQMQNSLIYDDGTNVFVDGSPVARGTGTTFRLARWVSSADIADSLLEENSTKFVPRNKIWSIKDAFGGTGPTDVIELHGGSKFFVTQNGSNGAKTATYWKGNSSGSGMIVGVTNYSAIIGFCQNETASDINGELGITTGVYVNSFGMSLQNVQYLNLSGSSHTIVGTNETITLPAYSGGSPVGQVLWFSGVDSGGPVFNNIKPNTGEIIRYKNTAGSLVVVTDAGTLGVVGRAAQLLRVSSTEWRMIGVY